MFCKPSLLLKKIKKSLRIKSCLILPLPVLTHVFRVLSSKSFLKTYEWYCLLWYIGMSNCHWYAIMLKADLVLVISVQTATNFLLRNLCPVPSLLCSLYCTWLDKVVWIAPGAITLHSLTLIFFSFIFFTLIF